MVGSVAVLVAAKGAAVGGFFIFMLIGLAIAVAFGYWGMKVVTKKGHAAWLGFVLGFFVSWVGIIICYVLPAKTAPKPMASMGMPGTMPTAPPMGGMAPPPAAPMAPPPAAPMATPPAAAPTPPPPAPPAPPTPPTPGV